MRGFDQLPEALAAGGGLKVEGVSGGVAVPVSAASLPLATGAATAALQGGGLPAALDASGGLKVTSTTGIVRVTATLTRPDNATPYAANDVIGTNPATLLEIQGVGRVNGGSGWIVGARLSTSQAACVAQVDLCLFNAADATIQADNVAFAILAANNGKRNGAISMPSLATKGAGSDIAEAEDMTLRIPFVCAAGTTSLWVALVTNTAFTPAALQTFPVVFFVSQD